MKKIVSLASLAALLGLAITYSQTLAVATDPATPDTAQAPKAVKLVQADAKLATLRVKFIYDGEIPKPEKIDGSRDAFCAAIPIYSEKLVVAKDGALKNLVLYAYGDVNVPASQQKAPEAVHKLDNKGCEFVPHIVVARPGQSIEVTNSDQTGHNANFNFFENNPVNFLVPAGGSKSVEIEKTEPAPIPVECNVHPWMKAHVIVLDHPYVGISDENGVIEIKDLPAGEITFRPWHESARSIDEVQVGGKQEKWRRGRVTLDLKPGMNDLGEIKISADKFTN